VGPKEDDCGPLSIQSSLEQTEHLVVFWEFGLPVGYCMGLDDIGHPAALKVHKIENFFDSDFGICVISLLVMSKY
jgi:hypothetical protein